MELKNFIFSQGNGFVDLDYNKENADAVFELAKENGYYPTSLMMSHDNFHYLHRFERR